MPIYEYQCEKCGHEFEREQRISDPPARSCPKCRGRKVTRLISRTAFVLKGGGWYADGYSSRNAASGNSPSDGKKSSSSKETPKSEPSKPTASSSSGSSSKSASSKSAA